MDDGSTYWATVGAIVVAVIGIMGNRWAKAREDKQKLREIARAGDAELGKARESRPWQEMERRLDDLREDNDRLEKLVEKREAERDSARDERDRLRLDCTDLQIEARQAAALRIQCEEERRQHEATVTRLRQEIEGMRG